MAYVQYVEVELTPPSCSMVKSVTLTHKSSIICLLDGRVSMQKFHIEINITETEITDIILAYIELLGSSISCQI